MPTYGPEYVVINEGYEYRAKANGKARVVLTVKSEPLVVNLDPRSLGAPVAAAIVHHIRERIAGVTALAAPATIKARRVAAKAFAAGKPWALKRYSGGKLGPTPPTEGDRALNGSGRLEKSVVGTATGDAWRINIAANRSDATTANMGRVMGAILKYVPELANPALLLENDIVRKSIERSLKDMIKKAEATTGKLRLELARSFFDLVRTVAELGDALAA